MDAPHIIHQATQLVGVTSSPNEPLKPSTVGVVFLNAGFLHHVGPNRLSTTLARHFSKLGFASVRFDYSGLGDSPSNPNITNHRAQFTQQAGWAMDFLASRFGTEKFVLVGLCSGAVDALAIARDDERVCGVVAIDGIGFRTPKFYLNHIRYHLLPRLISVIHIKRFLGKVAAKPIEKLATGNIANKTKPEIANLLAELVNRPAKLRFIYTGGVSDFFNYDSQFSDMFKGNDFVRHISTKYFPDSDHLFMLKEHQSSLINDLCDWMKSEFSSHAYAA